MLSIEPISLDRTQEELTPVRARSGIGHAQHSRTGVLERKVLVGKLGPVDALSARAIVIRKVTPLTHELGNYPVEGGALVSESLLTFDM